MREKIKEVFRVFEKYKYRKRIEENRHKIEEELKKLGLKLEGTVENAQIWASEDIVLIWSDKYARVFDMEILIEKWNKTYKNFLESEYGGYKSNV